MKNSIIVIGVGYVGLVSAACLSEIGHTVICLDIDEKKINNLQKGIIPIYEPRLEELVQRNEREGRLFFTSSYSEALQKNPSIAIIAVDTPTGVEGKCDISRVEAVARTLGDMLCNPITVVIKSTVPVHTNQRVKAIIIDRLRKKDSSIDWNTYVDFVSNPEFLREGAAIHDFMHADRIIVGVRNERSEEVMRSLYAPLQAQNPLTKIIVMDPESSELTKYAANTMLALRITFMNWLGQIAGAAHADIELIREGIGSDKRIGPSFLQAGVGFGGSCFPKDIRALRHIALDFGLDTSLIDTIEKINKHQRTDFAQRVLCHMETNRISSPCIGIWGLSFKPNTDDMREAPSVDIIGALLQGNKEIRLQLFDPVAADNAAKNLKEHEWFDESRVTWCQTPLETSYDADALLLLTEWELFKRVDLKQLQKNMKGRAIFDGRNFFSPDEMACHGFDYFSIGRPSADESNEPATPMECSRNNDLHHDIEAACILRKQKKSRWSDK